MERPDMGKPAFGPETRMRLIATTQSIQEANRLSEQYEMQGFDTKIMKRKQGGLAIYEVWIGKSESLVSR
jgi:hypothetical protein